MIALPVFDQGGGLSRVAADCFAVGAEATKVSLFLSYAEYCGVMDMGGCGRVELWTLLKSIPGHPKGSTIARQTLESYLFPASAGKYGSTLVSGASEDFKAVETPGKGTP